MKPRNRAWVRSRAAGVAMIGLMLMSLTSRAGGADPADPAPSATAKDAAEPAAPVVPAEVVVAMQGGQYQAAIRALLALGEKANAADDKAYFAFLQAIAERLSGQRDAARPDFAQDDEGHPASRWAAKIRFELAGIELAAGNWAAAEELARAEAVRLLAGDRKDQLAEVYHAFARKLLEPDDPLVRARPQCRLRAAGPGARAGREPGPPRPAPVRDGPRQPGGRQPGPRDRELPAVPQGVSRRRRPVRRPVPARRGPAQGQPAPAGPADLDRPGPRHRAPQAGRAHQGPRRRSGPTPSTRSPSTYGIPNPPDDTSLNQGVAALRRFLAAFPAHPKAVRAAYLDRRVVSGPRQEHRGTRGLHPVPQGGRLQGRDRRGPPRLGRAGHDGVVPGRRRSSRASRSSPRRSPPGRATWPSSPTGRRAPTPSARSSTPSS